MVKRFGANIGSRDSRNRNIKQKFSSSSFHLYSRTIQKESSSNWDCCVGCVSYKRNNTIILLRLISSKIIFDSTSKTKTEIEILLKSSDAFLIFVLALSGSVCVNKELIRMQVIGGGPRFTRPQ